MVTNDAPLSAWNFGPRCAGLRAAALCLALVASAMLAPAAHAGALGDREFAALLAQFQSAVDTERERYHVPGMTAAFVLPDGRVGKVASGYADLERRLAMTPDARILSGSTGKTIAAAVAVKLAEQGVWSLDDPLSKFLGQEPWFAHLPNARDLTLRLLLQHRGGLENYYDNPRFFELIKQKFAEDPSARITFATLIDFVSDRPPLFAPGQGYKYTDVGYLLVGLAIEQVTHRPYYDTARAFFLDPLGLTLTSPSNQRRLPGLAQGYGNGQNPLLQGPRMIGADGQLNYDPSIEFTAGGFVTNAGDLARWAKALYTGQAVSQASVAEILAPPAGETATTGDRAYYGLGVRVRRSADAAQSSYGHDGYIPGYQSSMRYYPAFDVAVAIQVNTEDGFWEEATGGAEARRGHLDPAPIREHLRDVVIGAVQRAGDRR